jgi:hypothetical protein
MWHTVAQKQNTTVQTRDTRPGQGKKKMVCDTYYRYLEWIVDTKVDFCISRNTTFYTKFKFILQNFVKLHTINFAKFCGISLKNFAEIRKKNGAKQI